MPPHLPSGLRLWRSRAPPTYITLATALHSHVCYGKNTFKNVEYQPHSREQTSKVKTMICKLLHFYSLHSPKAQSTTLHLRFQFTKVRSRKIFITRNTKISIIFYEIYRKVKLDLFSEWAQQKMLKNNYTNQVARNLTTTYEHFKP